MKLQFRFENKLYAADTERGVSLAIDVDFEGSQPNHFGAPPATAKPLQSGDFVGDTSQGGSCNVDSISIVPHCNGTHTETVGHVVNETVDLAKVCPTGLLVAQLITVEPESAIGCIDEYQPTPTDGDRLISKQEIGEAGVIQDGLDALIVRTAPNQVSKKSATYGVDVANPPYFSNDAMRFIDLLNISHLLVDVPSVDKMYDEGLLSNHRLFWNLPPNATEVDENTKTQRTITEMIFVPDDLVDGLYLLSLQAPAFNSDAAPSRPIVFPMIHVEE